MSSVTLCFQMSQDPATAIPKGTLGAIFLTTLSYLGICVTIGGSRHVSGKKTTPLRLSISEGIHECRPLTSVLPLKALWSSGRRRGTSPTSCWETPPTVVRASPANWAGTSPTVWMPSGRMAVSMAWPTVQRYHPMEVPPRSALLPR